MGKASLGVASPSLHCLGSLWLWDSLEVDQLESLCTSQCHLYYTLENLFPPGALGLNAFKNPWQFQLSYVIPPPALILLVMSKFLAECHKSIKTSHSSGSLLDAGSLTSHSCQHVGRCPTLISHCKVFCHGCFSSPGAQGDFNPLTAHKYVSQRQGFFSSVCQAIVEAIQASTMWVCQQC